jgi:hypothetical protein
VIGLLPLTEIRSPLFGSALVSTGFGVGGGILASGPSGSRGARGRGVEPARELGCGSVELRGGDAPKGWDEHSGTYAGFVRDLPGEEDAILKAIPRKQRAEVRRALGFGLEVSVGSAEADRQAHYAVYSESVAIWGHRFSRGHCSMRCWMRSAPTRTS